MDAHGHGGAVGGQDESPTAVEENVQVCWFCERLPTFDTFQVQHVSIILSLTLHAISLCLGISVCCIPLLLSTLSTCCSTCKDKPS